MIMILGALFLSLGGLAYADNTMMLNIDTNQKKFLITLASNPTTGFQWTVINYDQTFLQLTAKQYIAPHTSLMGAGGRMQFGFKLIAGKTYPTKTTIVFKYSRPWEPEKGILKTVRVNFKDGSH
jgi:inhibitor of cysteine peptidase